MPRKLPMFSENIYSGNFHLAYKVTILACTVAMKQKNLSVHSCTRHSLQTGALPPPKKQVALPFKRLAVNLTSSW